MREAPPLSDELIPTRPLASSLRRIAPYFAPYWRGLLGLVCLSGAGAGFAALEPLVMRDLFDRLTQGKSLSGPALPFLMLIGLLVGGELLGMTREYLVWKVRLGVDYSLLRDTVERLHSLPLSYHREQNVGATIQRVERGIAGTVTAFHDVVVRLFPALIYLVVSVTIMLRLEWRLALVVIALCPLPALLGVWAAKEQVARERGLLARWARAFARFNEVLTGILVVKSFVMEEKEKRRFLGDMGEANGVILRGVVRDAKTNSGKNGLMLFARIIALGLGGAMVMNGHITVGTLVAFVGYLGGLFAPVQSLTGMYQAIKRASASLELILSILDQQDSLNDAPDARELTRVRGEVSFDQVSFGYRPEREILRNISLTIRPGEMVAFVGPSGSGKSTLMALLQRLYDPTQGAITIDGTDLRELKQRSLRDHIGVVLQEGALFSDTIYDNILFGRAGASTQQVESAARAANAHEFIEKLPNGYQTDAGERGGKLSGGERQRIAIARALLKNAPIMILDEATSALDAESEEKVQEALDRLTRGRTTLVVAHRLSTIVRADRIVVFRDGAIAEQGTHEQLLRQNGYYASLVAKQVRGLLPEEPARSVAA